MAAQIAIVFGAGKNIGAHSVQTFKSSGFRVASISRSTEEREADGLLYIPGDLTQPAVVSNVFKTVRERWGEPSVVVYNAFGMHLTSAKGSFSISTETFAEDLAVNTTSAFVAAREAMTSFQALLPDMPKTFIYTGNILNEGPVPGFLTLGMGKVASAHMAALGDQLYRDQNIRFFFVDERMEDGTPMFTGAGSQAHADIFLSLADRTAGEVPWQITFVAGKGHVDFPHKVLLPENKAVYSVPAIDDRIKTAELK